MTSENTIWIGLDIGGAYLKIAHQGGESASIPFLLWKHPEELESAVRGLVANMPFANAAALTMTAELCDCFSTKAEGVRFIVEAVGRALSFKRMIIWGIDGKFHDIDSVHESPLVAAAANWLAVAEWLAIEVDEPALLIDIGSTTTDLIPLEPGRVLVHGRTDSERLTTGELVYSGMRRTPICALAREIAWRGGAIGLAAELFATTLDVYLTLGLIEEDPNDHFTADGRPATRDRARDRLARMIAADRETFSTHDALTFAKTCDAILLGQLALAAEQVVSRMPQRPSLVVSAGLGEQLAVRLGGLVLGPESHSRTVSEYWGERSSAAACAHAVIALARDQRFLGISRNGLV